MSHSNDKPHHHQQEAEDSNEAIYYSSSTPTGANSNNCTSSNSKEVSSSEKKPSSSSSSTSVPIIKQDPESEDDEDYEDYEENSEDIEEIDNEILELAKLESKHDLFDHMMMQFIMGQDGTLIKTNHDPFAYDEDEDGIGEESDDEDDDYYDVDDDDEDDFFDAELGEEFFNQMLNSVNKQKFDHVLSPMKKTSGSSSKSKNVDIQQVDDAVELDLVTGGAREIMKQLEEDESIENDQDFQEGIFPTFQNDNYSSLIQQVSLFISTDICMSENSGYYNIFQSAMKRFYMDLKRYLLTQKVRKESNDPTLQVSTTMTSEDLKIRCYEVQPSVNYLQHVVTNAFHPKSSQHKSENILENSELIRVAKKVIQSKIEKKEKLSKIMKDFVWTEDFDTNRTSISGEEEMEEFDDDPNDPEYESVDNPDELDKLKRFKTNGGHIKLLKIGNFVPAVNYDGQYLLKASPLTKKLYYKFFTFLPRYYPHPKTFSEKQYLENILMTSSVNAKTFNTEVLRDFSRFKISHMLSIEIDYEDIIGIHLQKVPISKSIQDHPLGLLVLDLKQKPKFYTKRIYCTEFERNESRERTDFTKNKQASQYSKHYIIGDDRELRRILSVMIHSDNSGRLAQIYEQGMQDISFQNEPSWTMEEQIPKKRENQEMVIPFNPDLPEGFLVYEDEEEEMMNHANYDSEIDEFDFRNIETVHLYDYPNASEE
nr:unnamed protein product [Naegleria fowleri]